MVFCFAAVGGGVITAGIQLKNEKPENHGRRTTLREDVITVRNFVAVWHELRQSSATTMPRMVVVVLNEIVSAGIVMLLRCRQRDTTRLSDSVVGAMSGFAVAERTQ
jgi:hypothetical protein